MFDLWPEEIGVKLCNIEIQVFKLQNQPTTPYLRLNS